MSGGEENNRGKRDPLPSARLKAFKIDLTFEKPINMKSDDTMTIQHTVSTARPVTDKERLDWLENKGALQIGVWKRLAVVWFWFAGKTNVSLRAAIDEAMKEPFK